MRFFSKVVCALAVLAAPVAAIDIDNPLFQDPYSSRPSSAELLLGVTVNTLCPNSILITVNVPPATAGTTVTTSFENTNNNNLAETGLPGTYNGFDAGASISAVYHADHSSTWTFRNFQSLGLCDPVTQLPTGWDPLACYRINVDVLDSALLTANPGFQLNPPNGHVSLNDPTKFSVSSWTGVCHKNPATPGGSGDPVFSGFQGQNFQFHGLPDEHFNLVSSPNVQLNSHFVYLSSGKCDYNDTECFTHPGTYMDVLGFSIADSHVKIVAGTHDQGLRIWLNDAELHRGAHVNAFANTTASLKYHHNGHVQINTDIMGFEIVNSDMFMNIKASLNNQQLLSVGSAKHTVTDKNICKSNIETHDHQLIEQTVSKKYPVTTPLHGLIGQTWRNVKVCGHDWMGTVQDYMVSDLFSSDNHYNYFKW